MEAGEPLAGRTEPRAQGGGVRGGLVMAVMGTVRDRLSRSDAAEAEQTEDKAQYDGMPQPSQHRPYCEEN